MHSREWRSQISGPGKPVVIWQNASWGSGVRSWFASLVFGLSAVWASHALAQWTTTLWEHNGSQIYLSAKGQFRQFRYAAPAPHLLDAGVRPGAPLFDGRRTGRQYSGTAYAFAPLCGSIPYVVTGSVSPDQRTVTLFGRLPGRDTSCRVVGYLDNTLVFKFSSSGKNSSNQDQRHDYTQQASQSSSAQKTDIEHEKLKENWDLCLHTAQNSYIAIAACEYALSLPWLSAEDRVKLRDRHDTLVGSQRVVGQSIDNSRSTGDAKSAAGPSAHSAPIPRTAEVKLPVIPPGWEPYLYLGGLVLLLGTAAIFIVILLEPKGHRSVAPSTSPANVVSTKKTATPDGA